MAEIKVDYGMADSADHRSSTKQASLAQALRDVADDLAAIRAALEPSRTGPLSAAGIDQGTTITKFKTTNAFNYKIDGVVHTLAATDDAGDPATTTIADEYAKDLISVDASGSITVTGGVIAASQAAAVKPDVPAGEVEIGWLEIPPSFTPTSSTVTSGMCKDNADDNQPSVGTILTTKG